MFYCLSHCSNYRFIICLRFSFQVSITDGCNFIATGCPRNYAQVSHLLVFRCGLPPASVLSISSRIHYNDVIMRAIAFQIISLTIVNWTVYLSGDQRKHQSPESLASVRGIHRWPVNSPHKGPVTRKMFSFDNVIIFTGSYVILHLLWC